MFKKEVEKILKKYTKLKEIPLEIPSSSEFGEYAFPCFILSKKLKKDPKKIAEDLAAKIKKTNLFEKIESNGPYVNFFINKSKLNDFIIKNILKGGYGNKKEGKTILVESPGPNTNKPLHLGHLRNMALGLSISNIFRKMGNTVVNVDIVNDRGIHISKSMLAYQKFGRGRKPNKKSDHFVGDFYVMYNEKVKKNKSLEDEAKGLLIKWENKDKEVRALWKKMSDWALKGIYQTYKEFGFNIDKAYRESEYYEKGKKIILSGLKKGIFKEGEGGSIIVDLEKKGLGKKVLLRSDGTSVYITQDLYLAKKRYDDFKMDKLVYVVASEQIYHFNVLFEILKMLKYKFAENCYHLAYGMIYLPEGKMKSREGVIVDADNIIKDTIELAKKEIKKRFKLSKKEVEKRAKIIGLGALKFFLLKYDSFKDFVFNPKEAISFEGETGPYVQYVYARIKAILRKSKKSSKVDYGVLTHPREIDLVKLLGKYPDVIWQASEQYKPNLVAHYLLRLGKSFNLFYESCPVLKADKKVKDARLNLILAVSYVIKDGLGLLGVGVLERM